MDNNPDKQPNDEVDKSQPPVDNQIPDVNSMPNFDEEPATSKDSTETPKPAETNPIVDVPAENPVPASSPFGPPIENLGTQPGFDSTSPETPVVNSSSASATPTKPISDIAPPTPVATTPNVIEPDTPADIDPTPAVAPVLAASSNQVVDEKKAAKEGKKTFIKLPKQKKSRKGLLALLIALVVIIGGLGGGYFYLKTSADAAADSYTTKAKTYLNEVYTTASASTTGDPADIKSKVDGISKPILENPPLSDIDFISSKHAEAVKLNSQVVAQVSALTATLLDLSDTYTFVSEYDTLSKEATTVSGTVTSDSTKDETLKMLADYQAVLEKMQTLVAGALLPDTLKDAQANLKTALDDEITATKAQITAFTADKDAEYKQAKTDLATAAAKEADALDQIKTVNEAIPGQITSATDALKAFIAGIKG